LVGLEGKAIATGRNIPDSIDLAVSNLRCCLHGNLLSKAYKNALALSHCSYVKNSFWISGWIKKILIRKQNRIVLGYKRRFLHK
jgi:hypothetical protein